MTKTCLQSNTSGCHLLRSTATACIYVSFRAILTVHSWSVNNTWLKEMNVSMFKWKERKNGGQSMASRQNAWHEDQVGHPGFVLLLWAHRMINLSVCGATNDEANSKSGLTQLVFILWPFVAFHHAPQTCFDKKIIRLTARELGWGTVCPWTEGLFRPF